MSKFAPENTSRLGIGYVRQIRHFEVFDCPVYLNLPAIRMSCTACFFAFRVDI